jgi:hypothetical protein
MAGPGVQVVHGRNGVIEFDDPDTGKHVVIMDGMTVESEQAESVGILSVAVIASCSLCLRRRITPIADYRHGWDQCGHCGAHMFLPPLEQQTDGG